MQNDQSRDWCEKEMKKHLNINVEGDNFITVAMYLLNLK